MIYAKEGLIPVGRSGQMVSLLALATMSVKEFEALRGSSLSFFQKIGFKLAQHRLRHKINVMAPSTESC